MVKVKPVESLQKIGKGVILAHRYINYLYKHEEDFMENVFCIG